MGKSLEDRHFDISLDRYSRAATKINRLFEVMSIKIGAAWHEDGIGSCGDNPEDYGYGLTDEFSARLPSMWEKLAQAQKPEYRLGGKAGSLACRFHAEGRGCILGDIKPANCLVHIEQDEMDVSDLLGYERKEVELLLRSTLSAAMAEERSVMFNDRQLTFDEAISELDALIEHAAL